MAHFLVARIKITTRTQDSDGGRTYILLDWEGAFSRTSNESIAFAILGSTEDYLQIWFWAGASFSAVAAVCMTLVI